MLEKNEMIFGVRAVIEAIQAGREIDKVLVKKDIQSELSKELFACLKIPSSLFSVYPWSVLTVSPGKPSGSCSIHLLCHLPENRKSGTFLV